MIKYYKRSVGNTLIRIGYEDLNCFNATRFEMFEFADYYEQEEIDFKKFINLAKENKSGLIKYDYIIPGVFFKENNN